MSEHKPNCAALTMMLMSDPPQRAKCDCGANPQWGKHQAAYEAAMDHIVKAGETITKMKAEHLPEYISNDNVKPAEGTDAGGGGGNDVPGRGLLELSFENGAVIVQLKTNKIVSVTKKGSIIIKDKKK